MNIICDPFVLMSAYAFGCLFTCGVINYSFRGMWEYKVLLYSLLYSMFSWLGLLIFCIHIKDADK